MKELWKPIRGSAPDRYYEVSNKGRVRGVVFSGHKPQPVGVLHQYDNKGHPYKRIGIWWADGTRTTEYVAILVAEAFCGKKPSSKHEVNHKDLNKHNNCDWNLEWTTSKGNSQHFYTSPFYTNRFPKGTRFGKHPPHTNLTWRDVIAIRRAYTGRYGEQVNLARAYGVHRNTVRCILKGLVWNLNEGRK